MTLIVGWIACDDKPEGKKKPSALYFGSDSRITWNGGKDGECDTSQKLYCCRTSPEMFAICGHVSYIQQTLPNLTTRIDSGLFFSELTKSANDKANEICRYFIEQKDSYRRFTPHEKCIVYYGTKIDTTLSMYKIVIEQNSVSMTEIPVNDKSCVLDCDGTGREEFTKNMMQVARSNEAETSRGVYHCISKTIENSKEPTVGGVPQIMALYRGINIPQVFGIIKEDRRYLFGSEINPNSNLNSVEWRDDSFQRIDPKTLTLLEGAQPQPFAE